MKVRKWLSALTACMLVLCTSAKAWAEDPVAAVAPQPAICCDATTGICLPASASTNVTAAATGHIDLDLSSTSQTIQVTMSAPVSVQVAGATQVVNPGDIITPALYVAVTQILTSPAQNQAIQLGTLGNAIGGTVALNNAIAQQLANLVIPQGVTAVRDFGTAAALNLTGNLVNSGAFYALSSNSSVTTAAITAANITNSQGALLSSILPPGGIAGFDNLVSQLNLTLTAVNSIVNQGVISSSGDLSLNAGSAITNQMQASLTAANNLALASAAGLINNAGILAAFTGNVSVASTTAANLTVNNSGLMHALAGSIDITSLGNLLNINGALGTMQAGNQISFKTLETILNQANPDGPQAALRVNSGTYIAPVLTFDSPKGLISVNAERLTGAVDVSGCLAEVGAANGTVHINKLALTGDPIFFAANADLLLSGDTLAELDSFGDFVALASGNITTDAVEPTEIDTGGARIIIRAGITFLPAANLQSGDNCPDGNCLGQFVVTGLSGTGGSVLLPLINLKSEGGTVLVTANRGLNAVGPVNQGNIVIGDIDVSGLSGAGGFTSNQCGICSGGSGESGQAAGTISVLATDDITTGSLSAYGGGGGGGQSAMGAGGNGGAGGLITVTSLLGDINIQGVLNASGGGGGGGANGTVTLNNDFIPVGFSGGGGGGGGSLGAAGGGGEGSLFESGPFTNFAGAGGNGGNAGIIAVSAPKDVIIAGAVLNAAGGGGGGGGSAFAGEDEGPAGAPGNGGGGFPGGGGGNEGDNPRAGGPGGEGVFGLGGAGGIGGNEDPPNSGGNGGGAGLSGGAGGNGSSSLIILPILGGAGGQAGAGGTVSIAGSTVVLSNTIASIDQETPLANQSLNAIGSNVTIRTSDTDFIIGDPSPSGSIGALQASSININGSNLNGAIANGIFPKFTPPQAVFVPAPNANVIVQPTSVITTNTPNVVVNNTTAADFASSNAQQGILNAQVNTKISTDVTQLGTNPQGQTNVIMQTTLPTSSNPGNTFEIPNSTGSGWKESGGVWSCDGCIASADEGGQVQPALRLIQRLAASPEADEPDSIFLADASVPDPAPVKTAKPEPPAGRSEDNHFKSGDATNKDYDFYRLAKGVAVFGSKNPVVVGTQEGNVHLAKGSLACVVETGHDVAIYNLHDRRSGSVQVVVGKAMIPIPPGKQLVLTRKDSQDFDRLNPGPKIAYRNHKPIEVSDDVKGFIADFSIPSAIFSLPPLKSMLNSPQPSQRKIAYQLLKNAVIMADIFGAAGPYKSLK